MMYEVANRFLLLYLVWCCGWSSPLLFSEYFLSFSHVSPYVSVSVTLLKLHAFSCQYMKDASMQV